MQQQGRHYERAFEAFLKARRAPFVALEQARQLLGTPAGPMRADGHAHGDSEHLPTGDPLLGDASLDGRSTLKAFDFVLYGENAHTLVEVKGRRLVVRSLEVGPGSVDHPDQRPARARAPRAQLPRLECWATLDDLGSLQRWERLFGPPFRAGLVFVYWSDAYPGAVADEVFTFEGRWYALRAISVHTYVQAMRTRSPRWRTVDLAPERFTALSGPVLPTGHHPLPGSLDVRPTIARLQGRVVASAR